MARAVMGLRSRGDVVDVHFALYGVAGVLAARVGGRPLMVHFHGPWADESAVEGQRSVRLRAKRALERAVYRRASCHVVLSHAFKRLLVERYGVSPWTVEVVPPAVDLGHFSPGARGEARERLGIPASAQVAVSVRRLTPRMGLDDLLRAWSRLPRDDAQLVIAGTGPDRARLEGLARDLGLTASVRFFGSVPEDRLPDVYRAADVCVLPSRALEGFGLVALEALACGTPVIVADTGGLPEAVAGLGDDLVVPVGDEAALAERLAAAFAGSRPLPPAERCRAHAERFSPARLVERHRDLYRSLLRPDNR
jgi:glycosyltransferase involved in cell wall biosynthesis